MGKTKRRLPYSYLRKMKGRMAAKRRGDRAVPPDPWDDCTHSRESIAPWKMAWSMGHHGYDADEIAAQLNKTYGIEYPRALNIGRVVIQRRR